MKARFCSSTSRAFTLTELLVVIAIMAVMMAVSLPGFNNISRSSNLTAAGQAVVDAFALARQVASTQNQQVEVRFYKLAPAGPSSVPTFCAFQLFLVQATGLQPLTRLTYFPGQVVINDDTTVTSTLLGFSSGKNTWSIPGAATGYTYASFHFLPSGETDLDPTGNWFATLVVAHDKIVANGLPSNYVVARIDPTSGKVTIFRP